MNLPKIVRLECIFSDRQSESDIMSQIAETEKRAKTEARRIGIKKNDISKYYDISVGCPLTDYPMYLLGPGAPKIENYKDALTHGNGRGKFMIVIREKERI